MKLTIHTKHRETPGRIIENVLYEAGFDDIYTIGYDNGRFIRFNDDAPVPFVMAAILTLANEGIV